MSDTTMLNTYSAAGEKIKFWFLHHSPDRQFCKSDNYINVRLRLITRQVLITNIGIRAIFVWRKEIICQQKK